MQQDLVVRAQGGDVERSFHVPGAPRTRASGTVSLVDPEFRERPVILVAVEQPIGCASWQRLLR